MLGKLKAWFTALSTAGKVGVVAAASIVGLAAASPNTSNTSKPVAHVTPQTKTSCQASVSYSTETQPVAFTSSTVNDDTLAKGQTKVTTAGVNGEKELQHKLTKYTPQGCRADTDETVSQKVTKDPVNQVTAIGTYVAPQTNCNPNYSPCVPNVSYDLDCPDIGQRVSVIGYDQYHLDADHDGIGCESY